MSRPPSGRDAAAKRFRAAVQAMVPEVDLNAPSDTLAQSFANDVENIINDKSGFGGEELRKLGRLLDTIRKLSVSAS